LRAGYEVRLRSSRRVCISSESDSRFNLVFALGGKTTWRIGERSGEIEAGGALFITPGETLSIAGTNVSFITLALEPFFLLDAAVRAGITRTEAQLYFRASSVERDDRLIQIIRALADELLDEQAAGRDLSVAAIIEQVIIHLLRRYISVRRTSDLEMSRVGLVDRRIRRAVELMHANLEREISVGELAAAAYLSPFHFARLFKKLMGASPHAYLARLRVRRAQILLADTDLSVTEVAARAGYNNSSHFAKSFRQATALTPREFRRAIVRQ
jgi:AraC family transcriptional regulator